MSLYRYVPSRDDQLQLMADHLTGEIDVEGMPSGHWRADLTRYAHGLRAMWLRHPWIATVNRSLPGLGPRQLRLIEHVMGVLDAHVPIDENLALMAVLNGYVESAARDEVAQTEEMRRSGLGEPEWTARHYPYIQHLLDSGQYPVFAKIALEARQPRLSREQQFHHGLERVLDCIAAALRTAH
jgi:hypothetical protein